MTLTLQSAAQCDQESFIVEYAIILFRRQTKCTKVRKIPNNNFQVNILLVVRTNWVYRGFYPSDVSNGAEDQL